MRCTGIMLALVLFGATALRAEMPAPALPEPTAEKRADKPPTYAIHFELRQGDPEGSIEEKTISVLASSTVATVPGRPAEVHVGGEIPFDDETLKFGTQTRLTVTEIDATHLRLRMRVECSAVNKPSEELAARKSLTVHSAKNVALDETVRIPLPQIDPQTRWCEIRIERFR